VIRLGLRVRAQDAELARAQPILAAGCEEIALDDHVEFVVYGDDLPEEPSLPGLVSVSRTPVEPGWETAWHAHLEPVTVGAVTIRPPWLAGEGLVVDPGNTFGLASHPTTQLCLELLHERRRTPLVDWGCGCGVLAVAASFLGYAPVTAIELDPAAVATARANGVDASVGDVTVDPPMAPTVVANLTAPLLEAAARAVAGRRPATVIASGMLAAHATTISRAWGPAGFVERTRRERDGWAALVLERVP
jgi:ribosomal protein L11 methyltransferase